jgi:hypothetical protein
MRPQELSAAGHRLFPSGVVTDLRAASLPVGAAAQMSAVDRADCGVTTAPRGVTVAVMLHPDRDSSDGSVTATAERRPSSVRRRTPPRSSQRRSKASRRRSQPIYVPVAFTVLRTARNHLQRRPPREAARPPRLKAARDCQSRRRTGHKRCSSRILGRP